MAGIIRHVSRSFLKQEISVQNTFVRYASSNKVRPFKPRNPKPEEKGATIESFGTKLENKGYLRSYKPYDPPSNVSSQVQEFAKSMNISEAKKFKSLPEKFQFLNQCFMAFNHIVPNSKVYEIETVDDVIEFYETPVSTTVPLDALKNIDLPENLHVQYDYHRFHPDTDTMFGGISAYPKSHTIVTGLKYKEKYRSYKAKVSWP